MKEKMENQQTSSKQDVIATNSIIDSLLPDTEGVKQQYLTLCEQNERLSNEQLANKIVKRYTLYCGGVGAITSVGGFILMLFLLPVDIVTSAMIEARMIYLLALTYGFEPDDPDIKTCVYYILSDQKPSELGLKTSVRLSVASARETAVRIKASEVATTATKETVIEGGKAAGNKVKNALNKSLRKTTNKTLKNSTRKAGRKAISKILSRSVGKIVAKVFPIVGALIGFLVNVSSAKKTAKLTHDWFTELNKIAVAEESA